MNFDKIELMIWRLKLGSHMKTHTDTFCIQYFLGSADPKIDISTKHLKRSSLWSLLFYLYFSMRKKGKMCVITKCYARLVQYNMDLFYSKIILQRLFIKMLY